MVYVKWCLSRHLHGTHAFYIEVHFNKQPHTHTQIQKLGGSCESFLHNITCTLCDNRTDGKGGCGGVGGRTMGGGNLGGTPGRTVESRVHMLPSWLWVGVELSWRGRIEVEVNPIEIQHQIRTYTHTHTTSGTATPIVRRTRKRIVEDIEHAHTTQHAQTVYTTYAFVRHMYACIQCVYTHVRKHNHERQGAHAIQIGFRVENNAYALLPYTYTESYIMDRLARRTIFRLMNRERESNVYMLGFLIST